MSPKRISAFWEKMYQKTIFGTQNKYPPSKEQKRNRNH